MSVDETDPVGPSSLKSGSPLEEAAKTIEPEASICQVDAAVAASKSLLEDDDDDDDDVSVKSGASEQRDPPQMGGFNCQPYDPREWEAIYNASLCNDELAEQLNMMTVSVSQKYMPPKTCKFCAEPELTDSLFVCFFVISFSIVEIQWICYRHLVHPHPTDHESNMPYRWATMPFLERVNTAVPKQPTTASKTVSDPNPFFEKNDHHLAPRVPTGNPKPIMKLCVPRQQKTR